MHNVVIIGSGCAGLTAAIYSARAGWETIAKLGVPAIRQKSLRQTKLLRAMVEERGEDVELLVHESEAVDMSPYERLIGDAMRGDQMLFVREDEVEAAWRVVEPVLGNALPVSRYAQGSWGPPEASRIFSFTPVK